MTFREVNEEGHSPCPNKLGNEAIQCVYGVIYGYCEADVCEGACQDIGYCDDPECTSSDE